MGLIADIEAQADDIAALRRRIHAHPELGFEEQLTSDLVAERLTAWGIAVDRSFAKTAVVGLVHGRDGGASKRMVGLRADMDALADPGGQHLRAPQPARRTRCTPAATTATPRCCWARRGTSPRTRDFDGTVVLIFQPAEEGRGGALAMVERRPVSALPGGGGVRHAQLARLSAGHAGGEPGAGDGLGQHLQDRRARPRQPRRDAAPRARPDAGGVPDRQRACRR